jgi:hypothetical protein
MSWKLSLAALALAAGCATSRGGLQSAGAGVPGSPSHYSFEDGVLRTEWMGGSASVQGLLADGGCGLALVNRRAWSATALELTGPIVSEKLTICPTGQDGGFLRLRIAGDQQVMRDGTLGYKTPRAFNLAVARQPDGVVRVRGDGGREVLVSLPTGAQGEALRAHPEIVGVAVALQLVQVNDGQASLEVH